MKINDVEYIEKSEYDKLKEEVQKKETDLLIRDVMNISAIGFVQNVEDEGKPYHLVFDFLRDECELWCDLQNEERIFIRKAGDNENKAVISKEFYETAVKTIRSFVNGASPRIRIQAEKNKAILVHNDTFGIIIAPRIESDEEGKHD